MGQEVFDATYQAAVRAFGSPDIIGAVERALGGGNIGFQASRAFDVIRDMHCTPSAIYRPSIAPDGNKWCALYGENLAEGVAGFGDTPAEAMADFDAAWHRKITDTHHQAPLPTEPVGE